MSDPVIVARADHPISRSSIDPDALKVLTRLHDADHTAYLVGGSVRDLLLGRRPKDFDVGTSAHPYQIKKLFRNCWIIGRRFRLAHVKFGDKAIEVATFRQHVPAVPAEPQVDETELERDGAGEPVRDVESRDLQIHRDNTFGTPEEDAFRRDFTVNALFYNIADRSIIDYVGGLDDIRDRVIRSIGDPNERFQEDPVRMLRAVVLAARLDFSLDPPVEAAIESQRHRLAPGLAGAADRGVLQGAALGRRRAHVPGRWRAIACSSRSRPNCRSAPPTKAFSTRSTRSTASASASRARRRR